MTDAAARPDPLAPEVGGARSVGVARAAALIGVGNVTSRLLGLGREQVIAALYGATGATSAFRTATRVSSAAYDLLLSGAITSALVPVFSDYAATGRTADLSRIASTFVNLTLLGLGLVVGLLMLLAPTLVALLGTDPAHIALAIDLTRLALPSVLLLGISGILTALLYARQAFRVPAFAPAVYNAGVVVAAVVLAGPLGIHGLALALSGGAALQILVQVPALRGIRYQPVIDWRHPGVRQVVRLYAPVFVGLLASYLVVAIDTHLAWRTGPESVADMAFATTLIQFPIGLVGAAASLAILPTLTRLASVGDDVGYEAALVHGLRLVLLLIMPLGVVLVVFREPAVALLFERQAFDAEATRRTALALLAYAPQIPFVVVDQVLIVAYYARKNTVTPVLVGVAGVGVYLAVALSTVAPLGMPGLALANAVQNSAHAAILYGLLARRRPALVAALRSWFVAAVLLATALSAGLLWWLDRLLAPQLSDPSPLVRLLALGGAALLGLFVYALCLSILRVAEVHQVASSLAGLLPIRRH